MNIEKQLELIMSSGQFHPTYVYGETGIGKTHTVLRVAEKLKREIWRINITEETDETHLFGHYSLIDGNTVWNKSPLCKAFTSGDLVLLDEIDLGTPKILCLQSIMEGAERIWLPNGQFMKRKDGFNVIATANTMGNRGNYSKYVGTKKQNAAFIDRFDAYIEFPFPEDISGILQDYIDDVILIQSLSKWIYIIKSDQKYSDSVSIRTLISVIKNYMIQDSESKEERIKLSLDLSLANLSSDLRQSLKTLFFSVFPSS